jgi:glycosyltransferase involved in cell wall biosynthesis
LLGTPYLALPAVALLSGRPRPSIREWAPLPPDECPLVSIIVPARNEEKHIGACLESLLASAYPRFEILVVDDRSTDDTARIVKRLAQRDRRVRLVPGADLPPGWYGKPWACWQGFEESQGTVLLFTDADTRHGPKLLPHAVAVLERERVDLVTVMPRQVMRGFWERAVQPLFFLMLGLRFGSASRINRNRNPRHAIANGQFILVTRESYEWVGGHRKVAGTVIDDVMMAVEYLKAGRRHFAAQAVEDMTTRMYDSLGGIVEGWSKNVYRAVLETTQSETAAQMAMLLLLGLPLLFLVPAVALGAGAALEHPALLGFGGASYLGASALHGVVLRVSGEPTLFGVFHPLGALVQAYILLRGAVRGTRRVEWKGRTYAHA